MVVESERQDRGVEDNRYSPWWLMEDLRASTVEERLAIYTKYADKRVNGMDWYTKYADRVKHVTDNVWCDYSIKVEGRRIVIQIDGRTTADWTEPMDWDPAKTLTNMPGRKLGTGTIAIQGHDPKSTTHFKELAIRPLP